MTWWWSWILAAVGVTGMFLAGSNRKSGWAVGVGVQVLWLAYAVATRQWGFLVTAPLYGAVNARNWLRWSREESARKAKTADVSEMSSIAAVRRRAA